MAPSEHEGLLLIGGGGHAMVIAEAAMAEGILLRGFLDDDPSARLYAAAPRLGGLADLERLQDGPVIIAMGDLSRRRELIGRLHRPATTVVHPSAIVSPSATLGSGVFIGPLAVVHARARIGDHATVNTGAIVEHDCMVGLNSHIAPGAVLGGNVRVGPDTLVGIGSRLLPGSLVGARSVVGAGAVVLRTVGDGETAVGAPARIIAR